MVVIGADWAGSSATCSVCRQPYAANRSLDETTTPPTCVLRDCSHLAHGRMPSVRVWFSYPCCMGPLLRRPLLRRPLERLFTFRYTPVSDLWRPTT